MYERFTDRAKKVIQLATVEAQRFNHEFIGTEHILLALLRAGSGVGTNVLKNLSVDLEEVQREVKNHINQGSHLFQGRRHLNNRAKKVIEYSMEEAHELGHDYVGTEHLLMGLLREAEGIAAQVLVKMGLSVKVARQEVLRLLRGEDAKDEEA